MSGLGFNKIAGAVLATALAIVGLRELSSVLYESHPAEKPGYAIAVAEGGDEAAAAPELPADWGTVLPVADVAAGEAVHKKCLSCHNFDKGGPNNTGPNLWGVLGRKPASHPGFAYSSALVDYGAKTPAWTYDAFDSFVKAPQKDMAGTKMTFVGLKTQQDRINLIAFLRTQSDSPPPIPAPKPAAAAPAAPAAGAPAAAVAGAAAPAAAAAGAKPAAPAAAPVPAAK